MKTKFGPRDYEHAASMIRYYGEDTEGISPQNLLDLFHEGIRSVAETYPRDHLLRVAVIRDSVPVGEPVIPTIPSE